MGTVVRTIMNICSHDIIAIAPLAAVYLVHRQIAKYGTFFLVLSYLPITIMHELAHLTSALLLGGRPTGFSLWPKRENGAWRLGSVTARGTIISAVPTALAPLAWLLPGALILDRRDTLAAGSLFMICGIYIAAYLCIAASIPSWQDIKVALTHPLSLILWSAILVAAKFVIG